TDVRFRDEAHLLQTIEGLIAPTGRPLSKGPVIDRQLPDGTRVTVVLPPLSAQGAVVTIRKFPVDLFSVDDLVQLGTLSPEMALFVKACVRAKINILVAGGRGSGKTAMLNVLGSFIPETERIITVEETPGLRLSQEQVVNLVWSQAAGEAKACEGADTEVQQCVRYADVSDAGRRRTDQRAQLREGGRRAGRRGLEQDRAEKGVRGRRTPELRKPQDPDAQVGLLAP